MFELWFLRYLTNIWTFLWAIFDIFMDNFVRSDERKNMSSGLIICCELNSSTFYSNEAWNRMEFTEKSFFTRSLLSYKSSAIAFGHVSVYVLTTAARPVLCTVGLSARGYRELLDGRLRGQIVTIWKNNIFGKLF